MWPISNTVKHFKPYLFEINMYLLVYRPLTIGLGLPPALAEIFGAYGCGSSGSRYFCGVLNDLLDGRDANNVDIVSKIKGKQKGNKQTIQ